MKCIDLLMQKSVRAFILPFIHIFIHRYMYVYRRRWAIPPAIYLLGILSFSYRSFYAFQSPIVNSSSPLHLKFSISILFPNLFLFLYHSLYFPLPLYYSLLSLLHSSSFTLYLYSSLYQQQFCFFSSFPQLFRFLFISVFWSFGCGLSLPCLVWRCKGLCFEVIRETDFLDCIYSARKTSWTFFPLFFPPEQ